MSEWESWNRAFINCLFDLGDLGFSLSALEKIIMKMNVNVICFEKGPARIMESYVWVSKIFMPK